VEVFFFAFFGAENFFWAARKVVWVVPTHFGDRCRFVGLVGSKSRRTLIIGKLLGAVALKILSVSRSWV
jgi:hypothetical protein